MRTVAVASPHASTQLRMDALPQTFIVWAIPMLFPLSLPAIFRSAELTRTNVVLGTPILALAIVSSLVGPVIAWLALNYLDRNGLERSRNRLLVHGALLAAVTPPLFTAMRKI